MDGCNKFFRSMSKFTENVKWRLRRIFCHYALSLILRTTHRSAMCPMGLTIDRSDKISLHIQPLCAQWVNFQKNRPINTQSHTKGSVHKLKIKKKRKPSSHTHQQQPQFNNSAHPKTIHATPIKCKKKQNNVYFFVFFFKPIFILVVWQ